MKFIEITKYPNLNDTLSSNYIIQKLEYFHHYWNFLFQNNSRVLLINNEKFESHRTLLHKLNIQLSENPGRYSYAFYLYFHNHPFFQDSNILIKKSRTLNRLIQDLKSYFQTEFFTSNGKIKPDEKNCRKHLPIIKKKLGAIEKKIISKSYSYNIIKKLTTLINKNVPLDNKTKNDIKFLISSIIIEL